MTERPLEGRRVLVVEDEYFIADDLREVLASAGAEVLGPLPTVAAATALIEREQHIDTAVLDINLQGEPVFPVADMLKARGVPFAFATGFDQWAIPDRFAGVPHLEKPQQPDNVLVHLQALMNPGGAGNGPPEGLQRPQRDGPRNDGPRNDGISARWRSAT